MQIQILSDLHLEFASFIPARPQADVIILAGDVHTGQNGIKWILNTFPNQPVVYVLGNHEFYGQKIPKLVDEIKAVAHGTNVHVLENDFIKIGDVTFLGATLWTDFKLFGNTVLAEVAAQTGLTDFRRIRLAPSYRKFRPSDARKFHARTLEWLRHQCTQAGSGKMVVISHHAPSPRSVPAHLSSDSLNPAYASNLEPFISDSGMSLWIHGHIHHHSDYFVGKTRVIANPRGYPTEGATGFDPSLVVEI